MEEFSDVRFKQRAVIQFLTAQKFLQLKFTDECKQCVEVSTVRRWVRRFKDGEMGQADFFSLSAIRVQGIL
jgi:hypothetical protein